MKRRPFLFSLASTAPCIAIGQNLVKRAADYENPYEEVDWDKWETIHSMSHQHQGMSDASRELFHNMGYRHFAFSNYYPSQPTQLSDSFRKKYPEIVWAPNAEQHSFPDAGLHFNSLGSRLATGYGSNAPSSKHQGSPLQHRFDCLRIFNQDRSWEGVYRLALRLKGMGNPDDKKVRATLTLKGANACNRGGNFADEGPIENRTIAAANKSDFRFRHIRLRRDGEGRAAALEVVVAGNDEKLRPNIQIRFVTDQGIAAIVDAGEAIFKIPSDPAPRFIRVEAFAYPDTYEGGKRLDAETVGRLDVAEVAHLHDRFAERSLTFFGNPTESSTPIPIADQIFAQPIRRL